MRVYSLTQISEKHLQDTDTFFMQPLTNANAMAIWNECFDASTKTFTIPEGYTHVFQFGLGANASKIEKLVIPKSIVSLHENVLETCKCLEEIQISQDNLYYFEILGMLCRKDNYKVIWMPPQMECDELPELLIANIAGLQKKVNLLTNRLGKYEDVTELEKLVFEEATLPEVSEKEVVIFENRDICIKISRVSVYPDCMEIHILNSEPIRLFYCRGSGDRQFTNLQLPKIIPYANDVRMKISGENRVGINDTAEAELMIEMVDRDDKRLPDTELIFIKYNIKNKFYAICKKKADIVAAKETQVNELEKQVNGTDADAVIYDDGEVVLKMLSSDIDPLQNSLFVKIWCKNFKYERTKLSIGALIINDLDATNVRWGKNVEEFDVNTYDIKIPLSQSDCGEVKLDIAVSDANGKRLGYTKTISISYITTVRIGDSKLAGGRKVVVEEKII